jgi:hypothetical protein
VIRPFTMRGRCVPALFAVVLGVVGTCVVPIPVQGKGAAPSCTPGVWVQDTANVLPAMGNGRLAAVSVASRTLAWAVGDYFNNSASGSLIEKWAGGTTWSVVGNGGVDVSLSDVTSFGTSFAVAVGDFLSPQPDANSRAVITQWNGSTWKRTVLPLPAKAIRAALYAVSGSSPSDVWAIGRYDQNGSHALLEHYNGSTWTRVSMPADALPTANPVDIVDFAPNDVWADGSGDNLTNRLWHYDGKSWSLAATPPGAGAITGSSGDDLWMIGYTSADVLEHWNGLTWAQVGSPFSNGGLGDIAEGAQGTSSLWAVGDTGNPVQIYIGENGTQVSAPVLDGYLDGIGTGDGLAFAVGYPSSFSGQPIVLASCD